MTSDTWVWFNGTWHNENLPVAGPRTHGLWLGSAVFDGARRFLGVIPDLEAHMCRAIASAVTMGMEPPVAVDQILTLVHDGVAKFSNDEALYIKPVFWPEAGGYQAAVPDPASTRFSLCIYSEAMPPPGEMAITLSPYRRSTPLDAPVDAKASCLYPNTARALREAGQRGFQNCVMLDHNGMVCELASANIFYAKDGVVITPVPNGCFLDGITRRRVINLLRGDGVRVIEQTVTYAQLLAADEIFSTGNFAKVMPAFRIEDRILGYGPLTQKARKLYWDYALSVPEAPQASPQLATDLQ